MPILELTNPMKYARLLQLPNSRTAIPFDLRARLTSVTTTFKSGIQYKEQKQVKKSISFEYTCDNCLASTWQSLTLLLLIVFNLELARKILRKIPYFDFEMFNKL